MTDLSGWKRIETKPQMGYKEYLILYRSIESVPSSGGWMRDKLGDKLHVRITSDMESTRGMEIIGWKPLESLYE